MDRRPGVPDPRRSAACSTLEDIGQHGRRRARRRARPARPRGGRARSARRPSAARARSTRKPGVVLARPEAARRQHARADRGASTASSTTSSATLPAGHDDRRRALPAGRLHRGGHRQRASTALRDGAHPRGRSSCSCSWGTSAPTAITLVAIPLSLVAAMLRAEAASAITINTMTLGGMAIAIGALVDDAIIDVENVFRRLRENHQPARGERRPALAGRLRRVASRSARSIVFATLIIILVFLPLFFLGGVEGRLLRPLGFAYVVAILASLLVAVTVTPVLCCLLLPERQGGAGGAREPARRAGSRRATRATLRAGARRIRGGRRRRRGRAAGARRRGRRRSSGSAFLPEFNEGTLTVSVRDGARARRSPSPTRSAGAWSRSCWRIPAVATTDRRTGRAELDEHAQGVERRRDRRHARMEDVDKEALLERRCGASSPRFPGTNVTIGQPIAHRIDHMLSGTRANIAVKIFGPDLYELRAGRARRCATRCSACPGVVDLQLEQQMDVPQLRIRADRGALARYGLTVGRRSPRRSTSPSTARSVVAGARGGPSASTCVVRFRRRAARQRRRDRRRARRHARPGSACRSSQLATRHGRPRPEHRSRARTCSARSWCRPTSPGATWAARSTDIQRRWRRRCTLPAGLPRRVRRPVRERRRRRPRTLGALSLLVHRGDLPDPVRRVPLGAHAALIMVNLPLALIGGVVGRVRSPAAW